MKNNINFKDEEMNIALHKSMEIYDVIKNTVIKLNCRNLDDNDKKYLSLLLGISTTRNQVKDILRILNVDYNVKVVPLSKSSDECNSIYQNNFDLDKYLNSESTVEDLMLFLLDNEFIEELHTAQYIIIPQLKKVIINMRDIKIANKKTLQKRKSVIL